MSTVLLSTIDEKIAYKTQGNVAPYTEGKGNGISFSLSVNKRENIEGSLPLTPTRLESITILSQQAADGTDGNETLDRISSAKVYESGVSWNELLVSSNNLVKGTRSIKLLKEELSFKAYTFGFPASKQLVQGKTYTVELLLPDETTFVVDINTGVPNEGNLSRAAFIVTKVGDDYIASNAATPLIEITGSDDVLQPTPDGDGGATKTDPLDTNSIVYADNIRVEEAKRFIKNIRWRWDVVSERGNKPKNGFRPKMTMRRFAPGAPLNSIRIILDMITDAAPYINPVVSGDIIQGKWKPRVTWFRKDMQQQTYDLRADATVTIIQDLVPDYEDGEGELVNGGGNCARIQEIEYVWDAAEVSTPPLPYPQGVTYDVQGINRDDESGLFNYMLVKSIAQEQHFGPYIASSSKKSYATREIYKNAYNLPAGLPQEGDIVEGGKVTQVNIDVNADCTYDITIVKSYTTKANAVRACAKTAFAHDDTVSTVGNEEGLDEAPPASGGMVTVHTSRLDDDGTYTNEIKTNKEEKDVDYITDTTSGPFLVAKTKVVRGSSEIKSTPSIGSSKATKSDGGLYTTEVTEYVIRGGEEATEKRETTTESKTTRQTVAPVKDITKASAENGKIVSVSARQDNQGAWHNVVETTIEKTALAEETKVQSPFIDTNKKTTKNATEKGQLRTGEVGKVSNILTAGGRTDVEVTTYTIKGGQKAEANQDSAFESTSQQSVIAKEKGDTSASTNSGTTISRSATVDEATGAWTNTTTTTTEKKGFRASSNEANAFSDSTSEMNISGDPIEPTPFSAGSITSVSSKLTSTGLYQTTRTTEKAIGQSWVTESKRPFGITVKTEEFRNNPAEIGPPPGAKAYTVKEEKNKYGLFDGSRTRFIAGPRTGKGVAKSADINESSIRFTEQLGETTVTKPDFKTYTAGGNIITESTSVDETTGLGELSTTERKPGEEKNITIEYSGGDNKRVTETYFWNAKDASVYAPKDSSKNVSSVMSISRNEFGLYSGSTKTVVSSLADDSGQFGATFDQRDLTKIVQEPHLDAIEPYIRFIKITYDYGIKDYEEQALEEYKESMNIPHLRIAGTIEPIRLAGRNHLSARYTKITAVEIEDRRIAERNAASLVGMGMIAKKKKLRLTLTGNSILDA